MAYSTQLETWSACFFSQSGHVKEDLFDCVPLGGFSCSLRSHVWRHHGSASLRNQAQRPRKNQSYHNIYGSELSAMLLWNAAILFLFQWEISHQFILEGLIAGGTMMTCSLGFVALQKLDNHWRKMGQIGHTSTPDRREVIYRWCGLVTVCFGPSLLMWMFSQKWPLYQKEMFFYASPNYVSAWLDPEDLQKIRMNSWECDQTTYYYNLWIYSFSLVLVST